MPNCFQLVRKTAIDAGPVSLVKIDEEMCEHFGVKPDPKLWYMYWYDTIGFSLAMGRSFERQIQDCKPKYDGDELYKKHLAVLKWLDENFTADTFATIGR